jgi:hypothetical protein
VPNDERSDFLWPEFLLPFPPPREFGDQTPPSFGSVFPVLGGVPFRPGPLFANLGPFMTNIDHKGSLAYIGEAPLAVIAYLARPN